MEPATTPWTQLPTTSGKDVAVFGEGSGLVAYTHDGERLDDISLEGEPYWCQLDPRGEVVWVLTRAGATGLLEVVDLTNNHPATVARKIPDHGPEPAVWIRYADNLGIAPPDYFFDVAVAIDVDPNSPGVGPLLGCEGDRAVYCFDEGKDGYLEALDNPDRSALVPFLNEDIAAMYDSFGEIEVTDEDALVAVGERGGTRPLFPAFAQDEITLRGLDKTPCTEEPEQCGVGYLVAPNRALYQVTVGNSRGDYYHEDVQLFDAAKQEFLAPDASVRATKPLESEYNLTGEYIVAPNVLAWLDGSALIRQEGGVTHQGLTCGWIGGGYPFAVQN